MADSLIGNKFRIFTIVASLIIIVLIVQIYRESIRPPIDPGIDLIVRDKEKLVYEDSGHRFAFVGGNHFNLLVKYLWGEFHGMTGEEVFNQSSENGIKVIRFWTTCSNGYWSDQCLYWGPNNWKHNKEEFFAAFDELVADAEEYEVYLIPVMTDAYYTQRWMGSTSGWNETQVCQVGLDANLEYKRFVTDIVTRYKDRDIILAWEIGNEGHRSCDDFDDLISWYEDSADFIRDLDERHLISTGEDNFGSMDKAKFLQIHSIENIDICSIHIYDTDMYKITNMNKESAVQRYVSYWTDVAHDELKMPIYFGEYGSYNVYTNPDYYGDGIDAYNRYGADGIVLWSWLEGGDCEQDPAEFGGSCITPERTPEIVDAIRKG